MPNALESQFIAAVEAHRSGNPEEAQALLQALLAKWPETHEAHYLLAMIRAEAKDFAAAVTGLVRALELDPDNPEYLFRLGSSLCRSGRMVEGADILERAAHFAEDSPELYLELARASLSARRLDRGIEAAARAWDLGSHIPEIRSKLASCYAMVAQGLERNNRPEEARFAAERVLSVRPENAAALVTLGKLDFRDKRYTEARAALEKALETAPGVERRRETHRMLGLVLDQMKEYDLAFDHFEASKLSAHKVLTPAQAQIRPRAFAYMEACKREITSEAIARWKIPPETRPSPVFFVGFPRSGTTLLEQMLGAHPSIVTTDELQTLPMVRDEITGVIGRAHEAPGRLKDLSPEQVARLRDFYWSETEKRIPAETLRGKLLLDKHPLNTPNLAIARLIFPGARVIMALRDPRDVVLSCYTMLNRTPISIAMFSSLESTAEYYAAIMDLWLHQRDMLGLPWIETRYEDLVENPEPRIRSILEFLGLPWDDSVLKFTERTATKTIRSASYQQVTQGIHKRAKGRWQNYEKHYGPALRILNPYLAALGYEE